MKPSVNFDPAAETYEATRGFPPGVGLEVASAAGKLIGPVSRGKRILEVGIGTGRIGRPMAAMGLPVIGVDLSAKMMAELKRLVGSDALAPTLVRGDGTRLPLADQTCAGVVGVHIFHLIPDWPAALAEIRRVLVPGGALLIGHDWRPDDSPNARLMEAWRDIARAAGAHPDHPGADGFYLVQDHLAAQGVSATEHFVGSWPVSRSVAQMVGSFERRSWSSTWHVPDAAFPGCLAELRTWARTQLGESETVLTSNHRFRWQRFAFGAV